MLLGIQALRTPHVAISGCAEVTEAVIKAPGAGSEAEG
jgi:hypothetical protein